MRTRPPTLVWGSLVFLAACSADPEQARLSAGSSTARDTSPVEDALELVVRDAIGLIPSEARSVAARYLGSSSGLAELDEVAAAVGMPMVTDSVVESRDSEIVVLNVHPPMLFPGDSIEVDVEWLLFTVGGGFWGEDWTYVLRCDPACVLLERFGPGHLN